MNEDYMQTIYGGAEETDSRLAAAGELLAKVAEEEGVDLDDYSDQEIGEMLGGIMGEEGGEGGEGGGEEVSEGGEDKVSQLTVADIAVELSKQAAAEGIDLSQLTREQYHNAYNYVHATMTDPEVQQQKLAAEEKVAEADMLGRVMAHSFDDELRKVAAGETPPRSMSQIIAAPRPEQAGIPAPSKLRQAKEKAIQVGKSGVEKLKGLSGKQKLLAGGIVAGTLAAGGGAAYARKKMKEKQSANGIVLDRAREILVANGINPDTGTKLAESEMIDIAALQLLREYDYNV